MAWAPARLGKAAPDGGFPWQLEQLLKVKGSPDWWQAVQTGAAEFGEGLESPWQLAQRPLNPTTLRPVWLAPRKGTAWGAVVSPWQSVLL